MPWELSRWQNRWPTRSAPSTSSRFAHTWNSFGKEEWECEREENGERFCLRKTERSIVRIRFQKLRVLALFRGFLVYTTNNEIPFTCHFLFYSYIFYLNEYISTKIRVFYSSLYIGSFSLLWRRKKRKEMRTTIWIFSKSSFF